MRKSIPAALTALALIAAPVWAADAPYAGMDGRAIASLSEADIVTLRAGEGWGLALPAELNGWPGPRHVLDMDDALELTDTQRGQVERLFGLMRAEAQRVGENYIEAEQALDAAFDDPTLDPVVLAGLVVASANALGELRMIHLAAHIETRQILTQEQIESYNMQRGYGADAHGGHAGHGGHGAHQ
jgi:Spy/CpxP family protein refolding chaperone